MTPLALGDFQAAFSQALLHQSVAADSRLAPLLRQPGFAVYRNTVMRGCIDALQANYPAILRLVGEEWFRAAAAVYVRQQWPSRPSLLDYGDRFAAFLGGFAPAAELPYLPAVARLDRLWTESHLAADAPVLEAPSIAGLAPVALESLRLFPHPAARWCWTDDVPAFTVWQRNRADGYDDSDFAWCGEGALLTRAAGTVQSQPLSRVGCALLSSCARGATLAQAVDAAATASTAAGSDGHSAALMQEIVELLPTLIRAGAFREPASEDSR